VWGITLTWLKCRAGYLPAIVIAALTAVLILITASGMAQAVQTSNVTFPETPWNGMQITYTIEGVTIDGQTDYTTTCMERWADATLTSRTVHVNGTWKYGYAGDGYNFRGAVDAYYHSNGNESTPFTHLKTVLDTGANGQIGTYDVRLDIPNDARDVTLVINETKYEGKVTRDDMFVKFTLTNPYYGKSGTSVSTDASASPTAKSDGLLFGSPLAALAMVLGSGLLAARATRKK
jgi:hypothetical protein